MSVFEKIEERMPLHIKVKIMAEDATETSQIGDLISKEAIDNFLESIHGTDLHTEILNSVQPDNSIIPNLTVKSYWTPNIRLSRPNEGKYEGSAYLFYTAKYGIDTISIAGIKEEADLIFSDGTKIDVKKKKDKGKGSDFIVATVEKFIRGFVSYILIYTTPDMTINNIDIVKQISETHTKLRRASMISLQEINDVLENTIFKKESNVLEELQNFYENELKYIDDIKLTELEIASWTDEAKIFFNNKLEIIHALIDESKIELLQEPIKSFLTNFFKYNSAKDYIVNEIIKAKLNEKAFTYLLSNSEGGRILTFTEDTINDLSSWKIQQQQLLYFEGNN